MKKAYLKDYMQAVPRYIYYDYTTEKYTKDEPSNDHDYDVYELVMTDRQKQFDDDPTNRQNFKNTPSEVSVYKDMFGFGTTLYLYWNDYKSSLYNQYIATQTTDIDLALNHAL